MRNSNKFHYSSIYISLICLLTPSISLAIAAGENSLIFSTAPAGTAYKLPAPNVIVSIDDSGSMTNKVSGSQLTGIESLKTALRNTFTEANVPNGSIRLGWMAMTSCFTIPSNYAPTGSNAIGAGYNPCKGKNSLQILDDAKRADFYSFIDDLQAPGATPSHRMLIGAGEYLQSVPADLKNSPWASQPGVAAGELLGCRKAYNIFMTDGGWNYLPGFGSGGTSGPSYTEPLLPDLPPIAQTVGNADGTARTLPDGMSYDTSVQATKIYRDTFGGSQFTDTYGVKAVIAPTLADIAFYYWATDLQPNIENKVPKKITVSGSVNYSGSGVPGGNSPIVSIPEYWNPKNDPATWQHMTIYAIGFNEAANWSALSSTPNWVLPAFGTDTWTGGDYENLITGNTEWPNPLQATGGGNFDQRRAPELWHMAINSRGKFVPAPTPDSLTAAFKDILQTIQADQSAPTVSIAVSATNTRSDSASFDVTYDASTWSGQVIGNTVSANTATVTPGRWGMIPASGTTPAKPVSTASIMDGKPAQWWNPTATMPGITPRMVISSQGAPAQGVAFSAETISPEQTAMLKTVGSLTDTLAADRVAFLRGNRSREQRENDGIFRNRSSRQGDIVNSIPWYLPGQANSGYNDSSYASFRSSTASRANMVYVGGNDGMLHGFDADTGEEKIAYVPQGVYPNLLALTSPNYTHQYYVDGSPLSGDLLIGGAWKTYLAGFLGAGSKGYFVLDVTDPSTFAESNAANLVKIDTTASTDEDIGYIFSTPALEQFNRQVSRQITKLNNGHWALVTGNGYNSTSGKAVLYIQYLDGDRGIKTISTPIAGGNGLSAPRLIDLNGDGTADVAYAGDLLGNLWKFDLTGASDSNWGVAFSGQPLYTAKSASHAVQPITSAPVWLAHPNGGLMIVFGTGRNLTDADRSDTSQQTIYGIYDNTKIKRGATVELTDGSPITGRDSLVAQPIASANIGITAATGNNVWTNASNAVNYADPDGKKGWYIDLNITNGMRVLENPTWFEGALIDVKMAVPAIGGDTSIETCTPPAATGLGFVGTVNAIDGTPPKTEIYSLAGGGGGTTVQGSFIQTNGSASAWVNDDKNPTKQLCVSAGGQACDSRNRLGFVESRPAWYQLQ